MKIELTALGHDWWEIKNPLCTWQRKGTQQDIEAYVLKLAPRFAEPDKVRICRTCHEEKPIADYAARVSGQSSNECRVCNTFRNRRDREKRKLLIKR
jgi:hypothetical protein